jgi:hypothetical protein
VLWFGLIVLTGFGPGCRSARAPSAANVAERALTDSSCVAGQVVDLRNHRPLAGRLVAIGPKRAVTDADGRFTLAGVPDRYDAVVVEPDRATASVYRGLRRRNPLLVHRSLDKPEGQHITDIVGTLSGGGSVEKGDYVVVAFLSHEGSAIDLPAAAAADRQPTYPAYGPLRVSWRGPDTITGELVALLVPGAAPRSPPGSGVGRPALLAHKTIALGTGFVTTPAIQIDEHNCAAVPPPAPPSRGPTAIPLAFAPVGERHVALTVEAPYLDSLALRYRWPALDAELGLPSFGPTHKRLPARPIPLEVDVPDLDDLGAVLCVEAVANHVSSVETCTFPRNAPAMVKPRLGPTLSMTPGPHDAGGKTIFAPTSRASWTRFEGGVQMLAFEAQFSSTAHPSVYIFTEETSAGWPDLTALGILFPADFVDYDIGITGFGPYASLDQALAPDGIGAAALSDRYRAGSSGLFDVMLSPTGAPPNETVCGEIPARICHPPPPSCNCGRDCTCETPCEMVTRRYPPDFTTANRALSFHPGLAVAAGMRCVHDCDGLRTFRVAYKRYAQDHPGFQRNEPLPTSFYEAIHAVPDLVRSISPPKH